MRNLNEDTGSCRPTAAASPRRIFLMSDQPILRHGMAHLIQAEPGLAVCGESETSLAALPALFRLHPAGALIDLTLPGDNSMALLHRIKQEIPTLPILIISAQDASRHVLQVLQAGAMGYITKTDKADQVVAGLRSVLNGVLHLSSRFRERLIFQIVHSSATGTLSPLETLTPREHTVLDAIGRGYDTRGTALQLGIGIKTVETHRDHIKGKLQFQNSRQMVSFAVDLQRERPSRHGTRRALA